MNLAAIEVLKRSSRCDCVAISVPVWEAESQEWRCSLLTRIRGNSQIREFSCLNSLDALDSTLMVGQVFVEELLAGSAVRLSAICQLQLLAKLSPTEGLPNLSLNQLIGAHEVNPEMRYPSLIHANAIRLFGPKLDLVTWEFECVIEVKTEEGGKTETFGGFSSLEAVSKAFKFIEQYRPDWWKG